MFTDQLNKLSSNTVEDKLDSPTIISHSLSFSSSFLICNIALFFTPLSLSLHLYFSHSLLFYFPFFSLFILLMPLISQSLPYFLFSHSFLMYLINTLILISLCYNKSTTFSIENKQNFNSRNAA